jgi:8-oxo-dGTP pyrophosphatase MutT (NUDIX family)
MKKTFTKLKKNTRILKYLSLAILLVMALVAAATVSDFDQKNSSNQPACSNVEEKKINSRRSLGLIIDQKKLLALKLDSEGNYSVPGGHIDFGETAEESLIREINEELGMSLQEADLSYYSVVCEKNGKEFEKNLYYLVNADVSDLSLRNEDDRIKFVDYFYESRKNADSDLKAALYLLKQDGLID